MGECKNLFFFKGKIDFFGPLNEGKMGKLRFWLKKKKKKKGHLRLGTWPRQKSRETSPSLSLSISHDLLPPIIHGVFGLALMDSRKPSQGPISPPSPSPIPQICLSYSFSLYLLFSSLLDEARGQSRPAAATAFWRTRADEWRSEEVKIWKANSLVVEVLSTTTVNRACKDSGGATAKSPATFYGGSRSPQVTFNLLVILVPFVRDENARIDGTLFRANWLNFDS